MAMRKDDTFNYGDIATLYFDDEDQVYVIRHNTEFISAHGETVKEAEYLFQGMLRTFEERKAEGKWGGSRKGSGRTPKWGEETTSIRLPKSVVAYLKADVARIVALQKTARNPQA